jgi:hypothetical protein
VVYERAVQTLTCAPGPTLKQVKGPDGRLLEVPEGWALLPPGDAGLTRRVKAAGPSWTVVEKVGRKRFSKGVWAPAAHLEVARAELEAERATPQYARKRAGELKRREAAQETYVAEFEDELRTFLRFAPAWAALEVALARAVTAHATPVGSGTVARTRRIDVSARAEAAVIAWMRHQTTAYDDLKVARVKGARREVRRQLAQISRAVLERHRGPALHDVSACALCAALA